VAGGEGGNLPPHTSSKFRCSLRVNVVRAETFLRSFSKSCAVCLTSVIIRIAIELACSASSLMAFYSYI